MKILKVTGGYPPAYAQGGTATAAHSLMKALKNLGVEVAVLTTNINGRERLPYSTDFVEFDGIPVCYCKGYMKPLPYHSPMLIKKSNEILKTFDIVLLDSSWTSYGVATGKVCQRINVPYIVYSHGCLAPERLKIGKIKKKIWWELFDKGLYNRASAAIALTRAEAEHLRNMGVKTEIHVIPNGVDVVDLNENEAKKIVENAFHGILKKEEYFLYLGRLDPIKGIDILTKAYKKLLEMLPLAEVPILVIAGPSYKNYDTKLKKIVKKLGISDKVIFTGLVKDEVKFALLKLSKSFILPSKGEGFPVSVLEALGIGVPVIISKNCYLPEISEWKIGLEINPTVEDLFSALKWSLENYESHKEMAILGKQIVNEKFSWEFVAKRTLELCEKILKRGNIK